MKLNPAASSSCVRFTQTGKRAMAVSKVANDLPSIVCMVRNGAQVCENLEHSRNLNGFNALKNDPNWAENSFFMYKKAQTSRLKNDEFIHTNRELSSSNKMRL